MAAAAKSRGINGSVTAARRNQRHHNAPQCNASHIAIAYRQHSVTRGVAAHQQRVSGYRRRQQAGVKISVVVNRNAAAL